MDVQEFYIERQHFRGYGIGVCPNDPSIRRRIPNALATERVLAATFEGSTWARLQEVLSPSPHRIEPHCACAQDCPGCQFQCMEPLAQRQHKRLSWQLLLKRIAGIEIPLSLAQAPRLLLGYRQRADLELRSSELCIKALPNADKLSIPMHRCPNQNHALAKHITRIQDALRTHRVAPSIRFCLEANAHNARLLLRYAPQASAICHQIIQDLSCLSDLSITSQALPPRGSHLHGAHTLHQGLQAFRYGVNECGEPLEALCGAWTAVCPENAQHVEQIIDDCLKQFPHFNALLEIGCGCGTHFRMLKRHCAQYTGIDQSWPAIQSAQNNQKTHHWDGEFYTSDAQKFLNKQFLKQRHFDAIVLHSNRLPYHAQVFGLLHKIGAQCLIVVAPTAFALAKSCAELSAHCWQLKSIVLAETTPWTYHQMGVALFCR